MKKLLSLMLSLLIVLSLAACSAKPAKKDDSKEKKSDSKEQTSSVSEKDSDTGTSSALNVLSSFSEAKGSEEASGGIESCADVYDFYERLAYAMGNKMEKLVDAHNDSVGGDYTKMVNIWYMPFSPLRYIDATMLTASISAGSLETSFRILGNEDAEVTEITGGYSVTYTATDWSSGETYAYKEEILFNTSPPALSVIHYHDGELSSFTEFQALGNDLYAVSSELERAIVAYIDGEIISIDHAENIWDIADDNSGYAEHSFIFDYSSGKIFGRTDLDHEWVMEAQAHDGLFHHYDFSDGVCTITGVTKNRNWDTGEYTFTPGYELVLSAS